MNKIIRTGLCLLTSLLMLAPSTALAAPAKKKASVNNAKTAQKAPAKNNKNNKNSKNSKNSKSAANNKQYARNKMDLYQIHNLNMWAGGGYSGLLNKYDGARFIGGGGGLLGIGYEWHYKKFILGLGPEFRLFTSRDNYVFDYEANPNIWDVDISRVEQQPSGPQNVEEIMHYRLDDFRENNVVGQVMLPVVMGAQFPDARVPMFFLAGFKVGYTLMGNATQRGNLKTSVTDAMAMDPEWVDMPVHKLQTVPYTHKAKNNFGLDVALTAEVGVNLETYFSEEWQAANNERRYPWHLRVSAFVDYGLPILQHGGTEAVVDADKLHAFTADEPTGFTRSLHASDIATGSLSSLLVGVKFAAQLQLNRPKQRKPQNPYMVVQLLDSRTHKPINTQGLRYQIANADNGKPARAKGFNNKGVSVQRLNPGAYNVAVSKPGYLPHDPVHVLLEEDTNNDLKKHLDTTVIYMDPEPVFTCYITDSKTGKPVSASVQVIDTTANNRTVARLRTNISQEGAATAKLPLGAFYCALVEAPNYQNGLFDIGTQTLDDIVKHFSIEPIEKGRTYIIENLFFASNETRILPQSEPALQELFDYLNDNPEIRIRITGHTDWVGSDEDNQKLSEGRAASVKQSMVDRGIDASRMETEGKGESQPVDTNETEEGRQHNRRVEFTIL